MTAEDLKNHLNGALALGSLLFDKVASAQDEELKRAYGVLMGLYFELAELYKDVNPTFDVKWYTREEIHDKPFDTLYLAYQAGYPLKVVKFVTGQGMVDVRTGESCEPTRFLEIKLPDDLK